MLKYYFTEKKSEAFLVKIGDELGGFLLLNKMGTLPDTEWNMGEFYIIAKFQDKGIAREVTNQIWKSHPGKWEVSIIPENVLHYSSGVKQFLILQMGIIKKPLKR